MALSILAVRVKPELKGDRKKSWACSVDSYGSPTVENWKSFFVGYNTALKEKILAELEEWEGFGSPEQEAIAQQQRQSQLPVEPEYDAEALYDDDEF